MMRLTAVLALVFALTASHAAAQPAPWQPDRITAGWTFTPGLAVGTLWDSNVTIRNEGNPLLQEWVTLVNPRGELDYNGRLTKFNVGYSGALEAYRQFTELNRYEQRARVFARHQMTPRLNVEARAGYINTPTTDRLELGTLPFVDVGSRMFNTQGSFGLDLSPRTTLNGGYRFEHVEFDNQDDPIRALFLSGGYSHAPSVSVSHTLTRRLTVGGEWLYRHANIGGGLSNSDVQNLLGRVSYQLGQYTSVSGAAGAAYLSVATTGVSTWGPSFSGTISHQIERTMISGSYQRTFVPTFGFGGLTGNQELTGSVYVPLTDGGRLSTSGSVTYSTTQPVAELGVGFELDSLWITGTVGYQIASWLRTEGFVTTMHQTSTVRGNFDRTRIGVQFITLKPVRIE